MNFGANTYLFFIKYRSPWIKYPRASAYIHATPLVIKLILKANGYACALASPASSVLSNCDFISSQLVFAAVIAAA